ncbi:MAG: copper amine oxidase N-terminal domain-containing protein [Clostridiales bacterium]|jgi:hypothetical protein|nr:copper amine oxidase N-terminal domain-containing protein [Clostridiales bacterium]
MKRKFSFLMAAVMATSVFTTIVPHVEVHADSRSSLSYSNLLVPKKTAFYETNMPTIKASIAQGNSSNSKINGFTGCNTLTVTTNNATILPGETFEVKLENAKFFFRNDKPMDTSDYDTKEEDEGEGEAVAKEEYVGVAAEDDSLLNLQNLSKVKVYEGDDDEGIDGTENVEGFIKKGEIIYDGKLASYIGKNQIPIVEAVENFDNYTGTTYDTRKGLYFSSKESNSSTPGIFIRRNKSKGETFWDYAMEIDRDDRATVTLMRPLVPNDSNLNNITIPLVTKADENLGDGKKLTVSISGNAFSASTLDFATVTKGSTTVEVDTRNLETAADEFNVPEIRIKENIAGALNLTSGARIQLRLDNGYEFDDPDNFSVTIDGSNALYGTNDFTIDGKSIYITLKRQDNTTSKRTIKINGLKIYSTRSSAPSGLEEIKMRLIDSSLPEMGFKVGFTEEDFVVAKRSSQNLSLKVEYDDKDEVPTLFNGTTYYDDKDYENENNKTATLILKELTSDSLRKGNLKFTFPSEVKVKGLEILSSENLSDSFNDNIYFDNESSGVNFNSNEVTLKSLKNNSDKAKLELEIAFYLEIDLGFEGDIVANLSGTAVGNLDVQKDIVVAKAINAMSSNNQTTKFTPGETVTLDDIILTENVDSNGNTFLESFEPSYDQARSYAIVSKSNRSSETSKKIIICFKNLNNYFSFVGDPKIEVIEGNLKLKNYKIYNGKSAYLAGNSLLLEVDESSSDGLPSKISISELKVSSVSNVPKGSYDIIMGVGVDENSESSFYDSIISNTNAKIATLQYGEGKINLKITIGNENVELNGQEVQMKYAPFIEPSTGTTYMQVSDIARLVDLPVSFFDNRVEKLEGLANSLFVTLGNRTFEIGKSAVRIDTSTIPETMTNEQGVSVPALLKDDYTCLPVRYFIEKVLNQKITWNGEDNTIIVE